MVSKRRPRFNTNRFIARKNKGLERSGGKGGIPQVRLLSGKENPAGKFVHTQPTTPRRREPQRPTNPHDPTSKDPFARAGIGLGTNDTKIFTRAGMSMDIKKMRKMF